VLQLLEDAVVLAGNVGGIKEQALVCDALNLAGVVALHFFFKEPLSSLSLSL